MRLWRRREGAHPASLVSFACRHRFALDGSTSFRGCRCFLAEHPDLDIELVLDDPHLDLVNQGIYVSLRMGAMPDAVYPTGRLASTRACAFVAFVERFMARESPTPALVSIHAT